MSRIPRFIQPNRRTWFGMAATGIAAKITAAHNKLSVDPALPVSPLQTEFVFEAVVDINPAVEIGQSSHGVRRYIPITGGTFHGPRIQGVVLPGGADWQLERPDAILEVDALYSIKTDDNAVIVVHNRGLIAAHGSYFRTVASFETPQGRHDWLNKAIFVGSVAGAPKPGAVAVRIFQLL